LRLKSWVVLFLLCCFSFVHSRFCFSLDRAQKKSLQNSKEMSSDLVVFSYNRPLQLYSFLESFFHYTKGWNKIWVVYRSSNERYEQGYQIVKKKFPLVRFLQQSTFPECDFKPLTLQAIFSSSSKAQYITCAVDDMIVTDQVDLKECSQAIEKYNTCAFYLRLGTNITYCYMSQGQTGAQTV
jgi:hypothetical protein